MKYVLGIIWMVITFSGCGEKPALREADLKTICNPVNLNYRFQLEEPSRREAADPSVVLFQGKYWLFASKSGGYWYSGDLTDWTFLETQEIPIEEYAPTAIAIGDTLFFLASSREKSTVYKTTDPVSGKWDVAVDELDMPVWDPAFFLDDDQRLYLYWGCSNENPLYGVEIDYKNFFSFMGDPVELIFPHPDQYGWEVPGDYNDRKGVNPWIEGPWMNKYKDKYYLQYAAPGTEFKSYADGVYVSDHPLGPYQIAVHNPFSYKPEGFTTGVGHGSTFEDKFGNYWHFGTITISVKHMFERRLGMFPVFFDEEGIIYSFTGFGDYPFIIPHKKIRSFKEIFPGWMLLSYRKKVTVSSSIDSLPPENMTDEDIKTYWAAQSGSDREWALIDLGDKYDVYSIQINFAEHNNKIFGRAPDLFHQYMIEISNDLNNWTLLIDKSTSLTDNPHDYIQLPEKISCRYLKIKNYRVPGGNFALSGFRVFGKGNGSKPRAVGNIGVIRDPEDKRSVKISWEGDENSTGYLIKYGTDENRLYHSYMIYQDQSVVINSLDVNQDYYFTVESFNENGITPGQNVKKTE